MDLEFKIRSAIEALELEVEKIKQKDCIGYEEMIVITSLEQSKKILKKILEA